MGSLPIFALADLPAAPGSYLLHLVLDQPLRLSVARLGIFDFPAGEYFYAGSARGPGGLKARVCRHARLTQHPHWHIDWLRPSARLSGGWAVTETAPPAGLPLECRWSQWLAAQPGAFIPAPGFGASDCRCGCRAHLVALV